MRIAISGFSGNGKSTLIKKVKEISNHVTTFTESARDVFEQFKYYRNFDGNAKMAIQKQISDIEFSKIKHSLYNKFPYCVYDRSIIDNFAFTSLFFGNDSIDLDLVQENIDLVLEPTEEKTLYTKNILICVPRNIDFIKDVALRDGVRRRAISPDPYEFLDMGLAWEDRFISLYSEIYNVTADVVAIPHFADDEETHKDYINSHLFSPLEKKIREDEIKKINLLKNLLDNNPSAEDISYKLDEIIKSIA